MKALLAALAVLAGATAAQAQANQYLIFPSQAACLTRSAAMCQALGCDGVNVIWWWDCYTTGPLSAGLVGPTAVLAGSYAMKIEPSRAAFGATYANQKSGGVVGLSAAEQAALVSAAAIAPLLPVVADTP